MLSQLYFTAHSKLEIFESEVCRLLIQVVWENSF